MADGHWMQAARRRMEKKGTVGSFTQKAQAAGGGTQEFARDKYNAPGKLGQEARYAYVAGHGHGINDHDGDESKRGHSRLRRVLRGE
jgi:hypothetical protein